MTLSLLQTRLWRKTRSDHDSILGCRGVDGNRNYGFHWNGGAGPGPGRARMRTEAVCFAEGGASNDKCFDTYHGPGAFSEPETAAIRDFIMRQ